jgi:DNA-directed RNA polymerase subunit RPC12/RpoP
MADQTQIRFKCHRCGQKYTAEARKAGMRGYCKNCNATIRAPRIGNDVDESEQIAFTTTALVTATLPTRLNAFTLLWILLAASGVFVILTMWLR